MEPAFVLALNDAVNEKLDFLSAAIDLQQQGQSDQARQMVQSPEGRSLNQEIAGLLGEVVAEEARLHEEARASADSRATQTTFGLAALSLLVVALVAFMFWSVRRRSLEESLRRSNEAKDELLGLVSHELRTPITVVLGNAKLLRRVENELPAEEREASLRDIQVEAERLQHVVENMLSLSRLERGAMQELELTKLEPIIRTTVARHMARYPGREVHVRMETPLPHVQAQSAYLDQVLQNLLSNAEKYGRPDGDIEVEARVEGDRVSVSVLDRGPGIQQDALDRIFEPFVRLSEGAPQKGVGLGLPVCRRLMQAQGGDVAVTAREGGGSILTFWLPLQNAAVDPSVGQKRGVSSLVR